MHFVYLRGRSISIGRSIQKFNLCGRKMQMAYLGLFWGGFAILRIVKFQMPNHSIPTRPKIQLQRSSKLVSNIFASNLPSKIDITRISLTFNACLFFRREIYPNRASVVCRFVSAAADFWNRSFLQAPSRRQHRIRRTKITAINLKQVKIRSVNKYFVNCFFVWRWLQVVVDYLRIIQSVSSRWTQFSCNWSS